MQFVGDQHHADENCEQNRYEGSPESRCIPRPEGRCQPYGPAAEKDPLKAKVRYEATIEGTINATSPSTMSTKPSATKSTQWSRIDFAAGAEIGSLAEELLVVI